ncbi:transmembrane protein 53 [Elysia marginata]|uniref:Transmembrane protein 53 n=1 Tax=Elysia marginata TaxID=1093978 RepID=A0AAV4HDR6_9GAST|nr:transmembrane protein 53 [Elysia marginata]
MALFHGLKRGHFERAAVRFFSSQLLLSSNKLSMETKCLNSNANSSPKLRLSRVSDRCHFVRAPKFDSWSWSIDPTKVLVVMITWLGAKDHHILRYSHLYTKQGLDVLVVKSEATDFIWPKNSMALAEQIYNVLDNQMQDYHHIVSHTMSAGSFNWTVLRMYLKQKRNADHICNKFKGIIFDSVVAGAGKGGILNESPNDGQSQVHALDRMVHGIVLSKKMNFFMQSMVESMSKVFFSVTKEKTVKFYEETLRFFREEPLQVPTLILTSRDDPMCDAAVMEKLVNIWRAKQHVYVSIKVWESSPHAQHYIYHKEEYESLHEELMKTIFTTINSPTAKVINAKSNL